LMAMCLRHKGVDIVVQASGLQGLCHGKPNSCTRAFSLPLAHLAKLSRPQPYSPFCKGGNLIAFRKACPEPVEGGAAWFDWAHHRLRAGGFYSHAEILLQLKTALGNRALRCVLDRAPTLLVIAHS
jgi:hypothetical protein